MTSVVCELLSLCRAAVRVTERLIKTGDNCEQTSQIRPFRIHRKAARLQHTAKEIAEGAKVWPATIGPGPKVGQFLGFCEALSDVFLEGFQVWGCEELHCI